MSDNGPKMIIVGPTFGLQQPDSGAEKVLSRIVSDALAIARERDVPDVFARIRLGKYDLCQSDYRQIVAWAQETGKSPEELISLLENVEDKSEEGLAFIVDDGSIKQVTFPQSVIFQNHILKVSDLRKLIQLTCWGGNQLTQLDISNVPELTTLWCFYNLLPELDLAHIPSLTDLNCDGNQLTELDLSNTPGLTTLSCNFNQLTELDLSNLPGLNWLSCNDNQLTELDLAHASSLTDLLCGWNQLTELDLSNVSALKGLICLKNLLAELDLSNVPALEWLSCSENQLTELDLSMVPLLTELRCRGNQLTELDVRENPELKILQCDPWVMIIKHEWQSFSDAK